MDSVLKNESMYQVKKGFGGFGALEAGISLENISKMNCSAIVSNLGVDFTNTS